MTVFSVLAIRKTESLRKLFYAINAPTFGFADPFHRECEDGFRQVRLGAAVLAHMIIYEVDVGALA